MARLVLVLDSLRKSFRGPGEKIHTVFRIQGGKKREMPPPNGFIVDGKSGPFSGEYIGGRESKKRDSTRSRKRTPEKKNLLIPGGVISVSCLSRNGKYCLNGIFQEGAVALIGE